MKTAAELVKEINEAQLLSYHAIKDEIDLDGAAVVTTIEDDEHRWYVLGTVVYKLRDEFFGIYGPVSLKSESMSMVDVGWECTAFEMVEVPSVTYVPKDTVNEKLSHYVQLLCRLNEAIAADFIVPLRVISTETKGGDDSRGQQ